MLKGVGIDLKIKGKVSLIKREKNAPPKDGVHRAGKDGWLKGVHSVFINDLLVPKGSVGFFYPINEKTGVKVYLGGFPDKPWASKLNMVQRAFKNMNKLALAGLSPSPHKIIGVKIDYWYKGELKRKYAYGLKEGKCFYPPIAWAKYSEGKPYDFEALDKRLYTDHSVEGYFEFCKKLRYFCKNAKMVLSCFDYRKPNDLPKLGDATYCMKRKTWLLVDSD